MPRTALAVPFVFFVTLQPASAEDSSTSWRTRYVPCETVGLVGFKSVLLEAQRLSEYLR